MKISVQLLMKPHMSMCQRINVPQNTYRSVNHHMAMGDKTANPFQNKNVTRFAQSMALLNKIMLILVFNPHQVQPLRLPKVTILIILDVWQIALITTVHTSL